MRSTSLLRKSWGFALHALPCACAIDDFAKISVQAHIFAS